MSKLRLTDVEWGVFFIGGNDGIFDITSTGSGIDKNKLNDTEGRVPYITRTDLQNGKREPLKTPVEHLERQIYL